MGRPGYRLDLQGITAVPGSNELWAVGASGRNIRRPLYLHGVCLLATERQSRTMTEPTPNEREGLPRFVDEG